jgi:hypothetical protein
VAALLLFLPVLAAIIWVDRSQASRRNSPETQIVAHLAEEPG